VDHLPGLRASGNGNTPPRLTGPVLSLLIVQISTGVALAAVVAGALLGRPKLPSPRVPEVVVASRQPVPGTRALWIGGSLVSLFWGIGVYILPEYAYHWPPFADFPGSWVVQIAGIALSIAGGILFSRAARTLGRQMTPAIQLRQGHELVRTGPYRYIRHPVYTAIMLTATGQTLFFLSGPLAVLTLLLVGLAFYRAGLEEGLLRSPEAFGPEYEDYMRRTGRFLPRLTRPAPGPRPGP
jgi:protein-S-isoprenylcysteine O-methyltransferase Ste14